MIINAQANQYRARTLRPGIRQRVAADRTGTMSASLRRALLLVLASAVVVVLVVGQLLHWGVVRQYRQVEQLRAVSARLETDNINLRAKRAGLMSPAHIEALAAVRLGLHAPARGQVHHL